MATAVGIAENPGAPSGALPRRSREQLLFDALTEEGRQTIEKGALSKALRRAGLRSDDPRLEASLAQLENTAALQIGYEDFAGIVKPNILLIERALTERLVIPEFAKFGAELERIFEETARNRSGAVADYIPQLGRVDPEQFGLGVCTVDGQRFSRGDATTPFCLQSANKFANYCIALETRGEEVVHRHIGREPSGRSFNELALNPQGLPHNPLINAGAILSCALIKPELTMADRFDYVLDVWQQLSGGTKPGFSNTTYLSERGTADRNFALGYFMREQGAFPEGTDLVETLEFYFQCCSLEMTADTLSVVAATLASGGICPLTGRRVFSPDTVQKCLSLMYSCGMYDYSGEWAFSVGLPAKSGVSGAIVVVVPNVLGLCTWSPRLDNHGNSVRGIDFSRELIRMFNFHNYDNVIGGHHDKKDPRLAEELFRRNLIVDLCYAAAEGDMTGIRRLVLQGVDLDDADYDGRTALHLAASEGQADVVEYFIAQGAQLAPIDRWGNTPLDDARRGGHTRVVELLEVSS